MGNKQDCPTLDPLTVTCPSQELAEIPARENRLTFLPREEFDSRRTMASKRQSNENNYSEELVPLTAEVCQQEIQIFDTTSILYDDLFYVNNILKFSTLFKV